MTLSLIADYSRDTLTGLVRRLQNSKTLEDLLYREVELDEVWRLVDGDRMTASARADGQGDGERLKALQLAIHAVHDLVADSDDGEAAARQLSEIILANGKLLERPLSKDAGQ